MIYPERVWLLRHAETTAPHVFNGYESDVPLSDLGRRQAEALGPWFRSRQPTAVVSSGMVRAVQTAAPIAAACDLTASIEPLLHERRVGSLGGQPFHVSEGPWIDTIQAWSAGNVDFTTPGAESFRELRDRLLPAWERVVRAHPGGRLVVVAHGVVIKVLLLSLLEGWDVTQWTALGRVLNLSISELEPAKGSPWRAVQLLHVPEVVEQLAQSTHVDQPERSERSEA